MKQAQGTEKQNLPKKIDTPVQSGPLTGPPGPGPDWTEDRKQKRTGPRTGPKDPGPVRSEPIFGPVRSWTEWTGEWTRPVCQFFWGRFCFRFPAPASNLNNLNPASRILSRIPDLHSISRLSLPQPQLSSGFIIILGSFPLSTRSLSLLSLIHI